MTFLCRPRPLAACSVLFGHVQCRSPVHSHRDRLPGSRSNLLEPADEPICCWILRPRRLELFLLLLDKCFHQRARIFTFLPLAQEQWAGCTDLESFDSVAEVEVREQNQSPVRFVSFIASRANSMRRTWLVRDASYVRAHGCNTLCPRGVLFYRYLLAACRCV